MASPIDKVCLRWFEGSPEGKLGVTERYVVFGEMRRRIIDNTGFEGDRMLLDVGMGHGFFTFELASRTSGEVVALDFLRREQLNIAKRGAKIAELYTKIGIAIGDARKMPFPDGTFDSVVSFLFLQDVFMTGGQSGLSKALEESARVLKHHGRLVFADNFFPECATTTSQRLYRDISAKEFGASLPSKERVIQELIRYGLINVRETFFESRIDLDENEARSELSDIVDSQPFGRIYNFEEIWSNYAENIRKEGLSYPNVLLITANKR